MTSIGQNTIHFGSTAAPASARRASLGGARPAAQATTSAAQTVVQEGGSGFKYACKNFFQGSITDMFVRPLKMIFTRPFRGWCIELPLLAMGGWLCPVLPIKHALEGLIGASSFWKVRTLTFTKNGAGKYGERTIVGACKQFWKDCFGKGQAAA